ncbi:hypothetical protein MTO96_019239 [Rhipicephalus appendiculatus]
MSLLDVGDGIDVVEKQRVVSGKNKAGSLIKRRAIAAQRRLHRRCAAKANRYSCDVEMRPQGLLLRLRQLQFGVTRHQLQLMQIMSRDSKPGAVGVRTNV